MPQHSATRFGSLSLAILLLFGACSDEGQALVSGQRRSLPASRAQSVEALSMLADQVVEVGSALRARRAELLVAFQSLPVAEGLEWKEDADLSVFGDGVRALLAGILTRAEQGGAYGPAELPVPPDLICSLTGLKAGNRFYQRCAALISAGNLRLVVTLEGSTFVIAPRFGAAAEPLRVRIAPTALDVELDLASGRPYLDVLFALLELDIATSGAEEIEMRGVLAGHVDFGGGNLELSVRMVEDILLRGSGAHLSVAGVPVPGVDLISFRFGERTEITFAIGPVSVAVPLDLVADRLGVGGIGVLAWAGLRYTAVPAGEGKLSFVADVGDFRLTAGPADARKVLIGWRVLTGPITGTVDGKARLSRFDLREGWQTTYTNPVRSQTTKLDVRAEQRIAAGSRIIDFRRSALAKTAARLELLFSGEFTRIDELYCTRKGSIAVELLDEPRTRLAAVEAEADNCLAGYFTKEAGVVKYNYQRL